MDSREREICAYLCLISEAVRAIDPDVLGQDLASLVQLHVLGQLQRKSALSRERIRRIAPSPAVALTLEALETIVDSPTPA